MAEENIIKTPDLGEVAAIDFASKFEYSLNKLKEALGVTRFLPLRYGNKIKTYKYTVKKPAGDGAVAEGETIPLTHVKKDYGKICRRYG